MSLRGLVLFGMLVGSGALTAGCGGTETQGLASGSVVYNGQPVQAGLIRFEPSGGSGVPRSTAVREGKYETALEPGGYVVRITAGDLEKMGPPSEDIHAPVADFVPLLSNQWNTASKLEITLNPGMNTFNFQGNEGESPTVEAGTSNDTQG